MTGIKIKITVEFDKSTVEDIDKLKKDISREEWIRRAVLQLNQSFMDYLELEEE